MKTVRYTKGLVGFLWTAAMLLALVVPALCSGCQPPAHDRKAAKQRWDKASAQIKFTLAEQLYDSGKYEQAERTVRQCLIADPQMPHAHLLLGKLLLAEGNTDDAVTELQLAVEMDKELHEGWYWLGVSAQQQRDLGKAYQCYDKAMSLEPTSVDYVLAVAEIQVAQDNSALAATLLNEKMAVMPDDISLKVAAADLMSRLGSNERAIELYEQAILMTTDNADIAEALGYCYMFAGKWKQAADIFHELVRQCTREKQKKLYLEVAAMCSMNCDQYYKAVSSYRQLGIENMDSAEIWLKMGQAALGAGMPERALRCGREALASRPGGPDVMRLIGSAQYAVGDFAAAADTFEKITLDHNSGAFAWFMRARCYERLGQTDKARQAYKTALEIDPQSELADLLTKSEGKKG
jgi:tetratricopeptide (TPR) repeat protein